jgi:hypothetical protein
MFKTLKYLMLGAVYKRAKKSFIMLFIYTVLMIVISLIMNDLIAVSDNGFIYGVVLLKWIVVFILLALIAFNLLQIFNIAQHPFEKQKIKGDAIDVKKEHILSLNVLVSKSDSIINKYTKD